MSKAFGGERGDHFTEDIGQQRCRPFGRGAVSPEHQVVHITAEMGFLRPVLVVLSLQQEGTR